MPNVPQKIGTWLVRPQKRKSLWAFKADLCQLKF
jgi:hypothetical protein